ncbi:MAG: DUF6390 family protein [Acidimicrobiales bacterium]
MTSEGAVLFARFAYPPNALGYCGPDDHLALLEYGTSGNADAGLVDLARQFEGAWPYLELIAGSAGVDDPLDRRVVEAYWLGNELTGRVTRSEFGWHLRDRFGDRTGVAWSQVADAIEAGGVPTHAFHVLSVYPWIGLLHSGVVDEPLRVLDQCRIRWGRLVGVESDHARVRSRPLVWRDGRLELGAARVEDVRIAEGDAGFVAGWSPGDWAALHWDWACDRLDERRLGFLRAATRRQLDLVNHDLRPGPAAILS